MNEHYHPCPECYRRVVCHDGLCTPCPDLTEVMGEATGSHEICADCIRTLIEAPLPEGSPISIRCGAYMGDNDGTCPQLSCIRERGHAGLCDNVSDAPDLTTGACTMSKRFILWDPKDGGPRLDEDGKIVSDGVLGRLDEGNVYLTTYGKYPDGRRPADLDIGERIAGVEYTLSKGYGVYDVYRVG